MAEGRYVLVFHEDLIANFPQVWDSDRLLATWLRLLALADKLWPSPAELPRGVSPAAVKSLTEAGLLDVLPKHRFTVRGLDAWRKRKQDAARNAAETRWGNAEGNADSNATGNALPSPKAMPRTDAGAHPQSGPRSGAGNGLGSPELGVGREDPEWPAMVWLAEHRATITEGSRLHQRLIRLCEKHTAPVVIRAMAALGDDREANQYVLGADNELNPIPQRMSAAERQEAEKAELLEKIRG